MNENIRIMLEKLSQDEEAQKKLSAIRDPEEAYQLVTSIHGGYTKEEFIAVATSIQNQLNQDLSEEDMTKVAGGVDPKDIDTLEMMSYATEVVSKTVSSIISTSVVIYSSAMALNLAASV